MRKRWNEKNNDTKLYLIKSVEFGFVLILQLETRCTWQDHLVHLMVNITLIMDPRVDIEMKLNIMFEGFEGNWTLVL